MKLPFLLSLRNLIWSRFFDTLYVRNRPVRKLSAVGIGFRIACIVENVADEPVHRWINLRIADGGRAA